MLLLLTYCVIIDLQKLFIINLLLLRGKLIVCKNSNPNDAEGNSELTNKMTERINIQPNSNTNQEQQLPLDSETQFKTVEGDTSNSKETDSVDSDSNRDQTNSPVSSNFPNQSYYQTMQQNQYQAGNCRYIHGNGGYNGYNPNQNYYSQYPVNNYITAKQTSKSKKTIRITVFTSIIVILVITFLFFTHIICFHQWTEATCTIPEYCTICGKTRGDPKGHIEGDWEIVSLPTLNEDGVNQKKCTVCGEVIDTEYTKKTPEITDTGFNFTKDEIIEFINSKLANNYNIAEYSVYDDVNMHPFFQGDAFQDLAVYFELNDDNNVKSIAIISDKQVDSIAFILVVASTVFPDVIDLDNETTGAILLKNGYYDTGDFVLAYQTKDGTTISTMRPK